MSGRKKARDQRGLQKERQNLFAFLNVLNQTLTLTHLVWRQGIALVGERVLPFLELDADWRAHYVQ